MSKNFEQLIDQIGNLSVFELSDLVKALEEKFGVSAAMPAAQAGAAAAEAAPKEEKSHFKVTLVKYDEKLKAIKALRSVVSSLSLTDAKNAVEGAPYVIGENMPKADAEKIKATLKEAGVEVELA